MSWESIKNAGTQRGCRRRMLRAEITKGGETGMWLSGPPDIERMKAKKSFKRSTKPLAT